MQKVPLFRFHVSLGKCTVQHFCTDEQEDLHDGLLPEGQFADTCA